MRPILALVFVLFLTISASASPRSDSGDRDRGFFARILRTITFIVHTLEQPSTPTP